MKRPVKAMVPLVDGMVEPQRGLHAEAHEHAYGLTSRAGGAIGRLGVWHDAPGHSGSAGRHTDLRGLGPHVGKTQEGAPDEFRFGEAAASCRRGSVPQRRRPGAS
jgi:hypothetical protein